MWDVCDGMKSCRVGFVYAVCQNADMVEEIAAFGVPSRCTRQQLLGVPSDIVFQGWPEEGDIAEHLILVSAQLRMGSVFLPYIWNVALLCHNSVVIVDLTSKSDLSLLRF